MPAPSARDRTRAIKVQARLGGHVGHLEVLVGAVVGEDWLTHVNTAREAEGRRPYRAGAGDERAALALFAHTPAVRERWPQAARAASQLGGILNAAHHHDAERWTRGDADRAEELAGQLEAFLALHPADAVTTTWTATAELGAIPRRARKPQVAASAGATGDAGAPVEDTARTALAGLDTTGWPLAAALPALVAAAASDPQAAGHVRVEVRRAAADGETTDVLALVARRSDGGRQAAVVTVSA